MLDCRKIGVEVYCCRNVTTHFVAVEIRCGQRGEDPNIS